MFPLCFRRTLLIRFKSRVIYKFLQFFFIHRAVGYAFHQCGIFSYWSIRSSKLISMNQSHLDDLPQLGQSRGQSFASDLVCNLGSRTWITWRKSFVFELINKLSHYPLSTSPEKLSYNSWRELSDIFTGNFLIMTRSNSENSISFTDIVREEPFVVIIMKYSVESDN